MILKIVKIVFSICNWEYNFLDTLKNNGSVAKSEKI